MLEKLQPALKFTKYAKTPKEFMKLLNSGKLRIK